MSPSRSDRGESPYLSLAVVMRDSAGALPHLLDDVLAQDLPRDRFELILVDGESNDETPAIVSRFADATPDLAVQILTNPGRTLPCGWNLALAAARGEAIVRVDVHARIAPDFLRRNAEALVRGDDIVGGPVVTEPPLGRERSLLYAVETSPFAGGAAAFRREGEARVVDTLAYAAYRRRVFATVGGLDERLTRNQDNELHCRIRAAGFRFHYDPAIRSRHRMRGSWKALLQQKFRNGYWVALASAVRPGCFALRHLLPFGFVVGLLLTIAGGIVAAAGGFGPWAWLPLVGLIALHQAAAAAFSWRANPLLPAACLLVHLTYGLGTFCGFLAAPLFLLRHRGYRQPHPVSLAPIREDQP